MVGGVKAVILLLALVLIAGGAVSYGGPTDNHEPDQHAHSHSHHDHYQPPPLLEMLPPIGPAGVYLSMVYVVPKWEQYLKDTHGKDEKLSDFTTRVLNISHMLRDNVAAVMPVSVIFSPR